MNLAAGVRLDARGRPAARGASRQVKPANDILRLPAVTFLPDKTSPKSFQERLSKEIEDGFAGRADLSGVAREGALAEDLLLYAPSSNITAGSLQPFGYFGE